MSTENLRAMFAGASSLNQPLEAWDVRWAEDLNIMFGGASSFNRRSVGSSASHRLCLHGAFLEWRTRSMASAAAPTPGRCTLSHPRRFSVRVRLEL